MNIQIKEECSTILWDFYTYYQGMVSCKMYYPIYLGWCRDENCLGSGDKRDAPKVVSLFLYKTRSKVVH